MHTRHHVETIFSSYIQFEADHFSRWTTDPHLKRRIIHYLEQSADNQLSKQELSLYWYQQWVHNPDDKLILAHLIALLQEAAYWAAYKFNRQFQLKQYSLSDCFQVAIAKTPNVLKRFNPDRGNNLETFAAICFKSAIADELCKAREIDNSTLWRLLRNLTAKKLTEALTISGGLRFEKLAQYQLAWQCFQQLYIPYRQAGTQRLPEPTPETWANIAALYNQEQCRLTVPGTKINAAIAKQWLLDAGSWARSYLSPSITSLNVPSPGYEMGEVQDNLPDGDSDSLLDKVLAIEAKTLRQRQQQQLNSVLFETIYQLKGPGEELLRLYYCHNLNQQAISNHLGISQSRVSRGLKRARKTLLLSLMEWSQRVSNTEHTSEAIGEINSLLELWLENSFRNSQGLSQQTIYRFHCNHSQQTA